MIRERSYEETVKALRDKSPFDYDRLLDCIHCGLCLPQCPSYAVLGTETDSPRGRLFLMKAVADGKIDVNRTMKRHLDLCLNCRGCETACPSGVVYHPLFETAQREIQKELPESAVSRFVRDTVLEEIFPYPERLRRAFRLLRIYQRSGLQKVVRKSGILKHISKKVDLSERFLPEIAGVPDPVIEYSGEREESSGERIGFLRGCVMDYFFPDTNSATTRLLEMCGYTAVSPQKVYCCGAVHQHNGAFDHAKEMARTVIDEFTAADVDTVVTNAAGCGAMMKEYGDLLADDPVYAEKAAVFSRKVKDISEVLAQRIEALRFNPLPLKVVYDDPCHLVHAQKIAAEPRTLLGSIPGLELLPLNEAEMCCGSAGTFNITQPELSTEVLKRKMENIRESGAGVVATGNIGCMIQFKRGRELTGTDIEIVHTVDLLYRSVRAERDGGK